MSRKFINKKLILYFFNFSSVLIQRRLFRSEHLIIIYIFLLTFKLNPFTVFSVTFFGILAFKYRIELFADFHLIQTSVSKTVFTLIPSSYINELFLCHIADFLSLFSWLSVCIFASPIFAYLICHLLRSFGQFVLV